MLLTGCHALIHQYPDVEAEAAGGRETLVIVDLRVDRSAPLLYKHVIYDRDWHCEQQELEPLPTPYRLPADTMLLRVQLDLYADNTADDEPIAQRCLHITRRDTILADTLHFRLPEGSYHALAWADYVDRDTPDDDRFFRTQELTHIETMVDDYPADTYERNCMAGSLDFDVDFTLADEGLPVVRGADGGEEPILSHTVRVDLTPPVGCYRFSATDAEAFAEAGGRVEEVSARIVYRQYVAIGYNVLTGAKNLFRSSYELTIPTVVYPELDSIRQPLLGDFLFAEPDFETTVLADFYLYDGRGHEFNRCQGISIPLLPGRMTLISGPFLTQSVSNGSGMELDENFEGEVVVRF